MRRLTAGFPVLSESGARSAGPVGLAVSGGSDSIALMHLAARWAKAESRRLLVLTVDHGLRPEAAAEAAFVASEARALGLCHKVLRWTAPVARQAAARRARHALLASALREAGGSLLMTGHTADDQAETFMIRARQGSGWYGLAGMRCLSLSPVWPEGEGIWIHRPLINLARAGLRRELEAIGASWTEDPSNENPAFERVRVRQRLAKSPGLAGRIHACQSRFTILRAIEDAALAVWLEGCVEIGPEGRLVVSPAGLPEERLARALGLLVQAAAGRDTPPRSQALASLAARINRDPGFRGATLGGVRLRPSRDRLVLTAEAAATRKPPSAAQLSTRIESFRQLLLNSAQDIAAGSGKESFLRDLVPILPDELLSPLRDLT